MADVNHTINRLDFRIVYDAFVLKVEPLTSHTVRYKCNVFCAAHHLENLGSELGYICHKYHFSHVEFYM